MPPKPESKTASRAPSGSKGTGKDKGKATGKEKAAAPAEPASDPAVLQQLRTNLRQLRQQCEQETQGINEAQMHKAKLDKFWAIEKQSRDDLKQQLMDRLKERADLEEKQAYEIKIYKEKVKHLLFEQQNETTETHYEQQAQSQLQYGRESSVQHDANTTLRQIKVRRKELFTAHQELMSNIKLQQEQALMAMRQDFERKAEEQLQFFRKRQKQIRREFHERRKMDIKKIETRKDLHISKLMAKHQQAFEDIKTYYRDITHNNLDLIKSLKDEVGEMKKKEQSDEKAVSDIHQLNAKLSEPLQKNLTLLEDLKKDLQSYELEQQELSRVKERIGVLEYQIKSQTWEQEILEQKLELLTEERNELEENLQSTIYDAQQKAGFKNLLLERKLAALTDDLEKTEVALAEVLSSANLKPELIGNVRTTLQDLMKAKNQTINALEQQIFTLKMQYHDMVSNFEDILTRHELPVENLGFSIQLIDE